MLPNRCTKFHFPKHLVLQRKLVPQDYSSLWCGPFVSNLSPSFDNPLPSAQLSCSSYASPFFIFFNGCLLVNWQVVSNSGHARNQSWTSFLWTLGLLFQFFMKKPCCHKLNAQIFIYSQLQCYYQIVVWIQQSTWQYHNNITFSTIAP